MRESPGLHLIKGFIELAFEASNWHLEVRLRGCQDCLGLGLSGRYDHNYTSVRPT